MRPAQSQGVTLSLAFCRKLTASQIIAENDVLQSDFSVDRVTLFSLRLPELLLVRTLKY